MKISNTLYIMSGPQASGKSYFGKYVIHNSYTKYVSRDEIRFSLLHDDDNYFDHEKEVVQRYYGKINKYLNNWFDVVADATQSTVASIRKLIYAISNDYDGNGDLYCPYRIVLVKVDTPLEVCLARNARRKGLERVPEEVIVNCYNKMYNIDTIQEEIPEIDAVWKVSGCPAR